MSDPTSTARLPPRRCAVVDVLVIAHPSDPRWERTTGTRLAAAERRGDRRDRSVRSPWRRPDRARRDRAGEVRQQPQRAARPVRPAPRERDRPGLRAPPRRAELDPRASSATAAAVVTATCSRACTRRACTAATTISAANGARVLARTHQTASTPGAALIVDDRAWPRPRGRARRLGPVRRRLHRRARPSSRCG